MADFRRLAAAHWTWCRTGSAGLAAARVIALAIAVRPVEVIGAEVAVALREAYAAIRTKVDVARPVDGDARSVRSAQRLAGGIGRHVFVRNPNAFVRKVRPGDSVEVDWLPRVLR